MKLPEVHPSHEMEYNDYSSDRHSDYCCKTCCYSTCVLCPKGDCTDDDELEAPCTGFRWTQGIHDDSGKLLGRRSGTGWPKQ